jgi:hypothetical protein
MSTETIHTAIDPYSYSPIAIRVDVIGPLPFDPSAEIDERPFAPEPIVGAGLPGEGSRLWIEREQFLKKVYVRKWLCD